jgi:hypothetical protein
MSGFLRRFRQRHRPARHPWLLLLSGAAVLAVFCANQMPATWASFTAQQELPLLIAVSGGSAAALTAQLGLTEARALNGRDWAVAMQTCVQNSGTAATSALAIRLTLEPLGGAQLDCALQPLRLTVDVSAHPVLQPRERYCYPVSFKLEVPDGLAYRAAAQVTIDNHAGWIPPAQNCPGPASCPYGPQPEITFSRADLQLLAPTATALPVVQPAFPSPAAPLLPPALTPTTASSPTLAASPTPTASSTPWAADLAAEVKYQPIWATDGIQLQAACRLKNQGGPSADLNWQAQILLADANGQPAEPVSEIWEDTSAGLDHAQEIEKQFTLRFTPADGQTYLLRVDLWAGGQPCEQRELCPPALSTLKALNLPMLFPTAEILPSATPAITETAAVLPVQPPAAP